MFYKILYIFFVVFCFGVKKKKGGMLYNLKVLIGKIIYYM